VTDRLTRDWDDLARIDPMFTILSDVSKDAGRWDVEDFFETGRHDFVATMARAEEWSLPVSNELALDFGCGIGRVTQAMATRFEHCVGVDVSAAMISQAREFGQGMARLEFVHNVDSDLRLFGDGQFDLVYCSVVLQHLGRRSLVGSFIGEFCRVLRPGGLLVFQVPHALALRSRLQLRRRLHHVLRSLRVGSETLAAAGIYPIGMLSVPPRRVERCLRDSDEEIVQLCVDVTRTPRYPSATYWVTRRSAVS